ncbi:hypothetical protein J8273_7925 [Carpediemonas membranifera]|uniref:Uncharacterized protein n=1 Tax=Carpediemonas membranifera TaxID=201153 RepID=A0A8J6AYT7_9EUKA|nr:hypothetical protein J8273_7925 [Carpediemonas membranifera]|eukprot:KAG9390574.1 hypothetical protein J8273_7925 [Carpediemonas membranifera]
MERSMRQEERAVVDKSRSFPLLWGPDNSRLSIPIPPTVVFTAPKVADWYLYSAKYNGIVRVSTQDTTIEAIQASFQRLREMNEFGSVEHASVFQGRLPPCHIFENELHAVLDYGFTGQLEVPRTHPDTIPNTRHGEHAGMFQSLCFPFAVQLYVPGPRLSVGVTNTSDTARGYEYQLPVACGAAMSAYLKRTIALVASHVSSVHGIDLTGLSLMLAGKKLRGLGARLPVTLLSVTRLQFMAAEGGQTGPFHSFSVVDCINDCDNLEPVEVRTPESMQSVRVRPISATVRREAQQRPATPQRAPVPTQSSQRSPSDRSLRSSRAGTTSLCHTMVGGDQGATGTMYRVGTAVVRSGSRASNGMTTAGLRDRTRPATGTLLRRAQTTRMYTPVRTAGPFRGSAQRLSRTGTNSSGSTATFLYELARTNPQGAAARLAEFNADKRREQQNNSRDIFSDVRARLTERAMQATRTAKVPRRPPMLAPRTNMAQLRGKTISLHEQFSNLDVTRDFVPISGSTLRGVRAAR